MPGIFKNGGSSSSGIPTGQSAVINYCAPNGDAELNATTGWANFADAAASTPVDLTGGSPVTAIAVSGTTPLRGTYSYTWVKSANNRQGEGTSFAFTINAADKGKMLNISFDYLISSGTYVDNDMGIWVYDVTNSTLIQPAPYNILNTGVAATWSGVFQAASNSTSYRVGFYTQSVSAVAYTLQFDNFAVGPQIKSIGPAMTDWVAYTPTIGGFGTVSAVGVYSRRVGDTLQVRGKFTNGTVAASSATMTLGYNGVNANVTVDTTKVTASAKQILGSAGSDTNGTTVFNWIITYGDTSTVYFGVQNSTNPAINTPTNGSTVSGNSNQISFYFEVPISGWSSSQVQSSDADTRVTAMHVSGGTLPTTSAYDGTVATIFPATPTFDTHGAYSTSTGKYTVKVPGIYRVTFNLGVAGTWTAGQFVLYTIKKNTTTQFYQQTVIAGTTGPVVSGTTGLVQVVAGDTIEPRIFTNATGPSIQNDSNSNFFSVDRLSGPVQIQASESVNARYYASSTAVTGALATVVWTTKDFDSHNQMSSGVYTVPVAGKYQVNSYVGNTGTFILNNLLTIEIQKNGTVVSRGKTYAGGATTQMDAGVADVISCVAGDTIRIQISNSGTTPAIVSSNFENWVSIARVGQ